MTRYLLAVLLTTHPMLGQGLTRWEQLNEAGKRAVELGRFGEAYSQLERWAQAARTLELAEQAWVNVAGADELNLAVVWRDRGVVCEAQKQYARANEFYKRALVRTSVLLDLSIPMSPST